MKIITRHLSAFILISAALITGYSAALAQSTRVEAVLFFSPSCGHCQKVMTEDLPPLQDKYGEQLRIYTVDTSEQDGRTLFEAALERYQVPNERRGVPMLVIGETILVGSREIPQQFPGLIDSALMSAGSGLPDIPGLNADKLPLFMTSQTQPGAADQEPVSTPSPPAHASSGQQEDQQPGVSNRSPLVNTFMKDPAGNTLAVILLVAMTIGIIWAVWSFLTKSHIDNIGWSHWAVPALAIAGMFVAAYLTYVETTHTQAVCGPIGNCNAVQQSPYAYVLGFIPVGLLGLVGYILILATWIMYRRGPTHLRSMAALLCWGLVWFGVFFSLYLTFLEPFVIGATCAWCVASATIMTLLLLATTGPAINAWNPEE